MDTDLNSVDEEQLQVEETDDSCRVDFIEIVPLTRDTDFSCKTECDSGDWFGEVREVDLADLKQEPDDDYGSSTTECVNGNCFPALREVDLADLKQEPRDDSESSAMCCVKYEANADEKLSHMRPVVVLETRNLARLQKKCHVWINTGESSCEVKTEADSSDHTEHSHDDKPRPYLCTVCDKRFIWKQHLIRHSKIHSAENVCTTKNSLKVNRKQQTAGNNVLHCAFYTGESSIEVKTEADSSDHTEHPHDDKPRPYLCTTKNSLKVHRKRQTGGNWYSCTQCDKRYMSQGALCEHMNIHRGTYKCTECGKCCGNKQNLAVHERSHSGEKPFECSVCSKRFITSSDLDRHSRIHSGHKPFECSVCSKRFVTSSALVTHSRVHSGEKPFICHVCDKAFSQRGGLNCHLRFHTGEKPYRCYRCNKAFTLSVHLKHHMRIHTRDEPYKCYLCGKSFASGDIKSHLRVHTGERPLYVFRM